MSLILVDEGLCTRCGICSKVCIAGFIAPDENALPHVDDDKARYCRQCGHCEATCPSQALILNYRPDERITLPEDGGTLSAERLGIYMKKRRSVRYFRKDRVPKEKIMAALDVAQYAPSGGNLQPVQWQVVSDPGELRKIGQATIEWMKTLQGTNNPVAGYVSIIIDAWNAGTDLIFHGAPHLLIAHIPEDVSPTAYVDAIIAMAHFDIAAPASGIGTCWIGSIALAEGQYPPFREALGIPQGRKLAYAMTFGYPQFKIHSIPRRKPVQVTWR